MKTRLCLALAAALLAGGARAAADPVLPPTVADLTGARAAALGAYRGLGAGNESIFLNPAAMSAHRRYSIEAHWLLERSGADDAGQFLSLSTVDSQMGALAGGLAYTRVASGPSVGNALHLALATRLGGPLHVGVTGKYLSLDGAERVRAATVDAAVYLIVSRLVSVGAAAYNLVDVNHPQQAPRGYGAGLAFGDDRRFRLAADWRRDEERRGESTDAWGAGLEVLVLGNFPLRGGWQRDETRDVEWWSAGVGLVSTSGLALDLTYRQSFDDASDRLFGVALKLFLLAGSP